MADGDNINKNRRNKYEKIVNLYRKDVYKIRIEK
jgi:hypothetical protein